MIKCVCHDCMHLKSVVCETDLPQESIEETCDFGFPSEDCITCELEGCTLTCDHYEEHQQAPVHMLERRCALCQAPVQVMEGTLGVDVVYCVTCYLTKG